MQTMNMVLCGLGGQGILFMTKVVAQAALDKGFKVMGAETHGMAQRGGSVVSHLRIGEVQSSLVRTGSAQFLLALEENEGYRNLPFLSKGAGMFVNGDPDRFPRDEAKGFLETKGVHYHAMPVGKIAQELGAPRSANLALLGFFSAFDGFMVHADALRETLGRISPERFREANLKVFDTCHEKGVKSR
ncbi:MAG: indolepyruvate oxidoreductase subunit beta [Deltaproteobacteria bacterium]|nr:indolepyruvate oxidoreductase subunit beta [Deltaproteobacteria bacterium]